MTRNTNLFVFFFAIAIASTGCTSDSNQPRAETSKSTPVRVEPIQALPPKKAITTDPAPIPKKLTPKEISDLKDALFWEALSDLNSLWNEGWKGIRGVANVFKSREDRYNSVIGEEFSKLLPQDQAVAREIKSKINANRDLSSEEWRFAKRHIVECSPEIIRLAQRMPTVFHELKAYAKNPEAFESLRAEFFLTLDVLDQLITVEVAKRARSGAVMNRREQDIYYNSGIMKELRKNDPTTFLPLPPPPFAELQARMAGTFEREKEVMLAIDSHLRSGKFAEAKGIAMAAQNETKALDLELLRGLFDWRSETINRPMPLNTPGREKCTAFKMVNALLSQEPERSRLKADVFSQKPNYLKFSPLFE